MSAASRNPPRVLAVDLALLQRGERVRARPVAIEGSPGAAPLARIAAWGGGATALALFAEAVARGAGPLDEVDELFAVYAGAAVRAGLPTAARAGVLARAPLTGRLAEGQVGGELGLRLARICDVLLVSGRTSEVGAVLILDEDGSAHLERMPELVGRSPAERHALLSERFASPATLTLGPAGELGLPFASLASGGPRPSFVGRGGLGAVVGRSGLAGIVVCGESVSPSTSDEARELTQRLSASPRLDERGTRGTHELFGALAARGALPRDYAQRMSRAARDKADERKGCRGCPTPCGWSFQRDDGSKQGAHFSATHPLGERLGLVGESAFDDALALLAECDRAGVDAKELGALLALACEAAERGSLNVESARGDRERLLTWARAITGVGEAAELDSVLASLRAGPARFAAEHGLAHEAVRGATVRPEQGLASLLGQCTSASGSDPMRSFPFLFDAADEERLARIVHGLPLCDGLLDPGDPRGKGRLVAWHENLVSGIDMSGFCAFSTAGLLADEVVDLDTLARWVAPAALLAEESVQGTPGERLLAAGAALVLLRRELNRAFGQAAGEDLPAWAESRLAEPGMLDEYRRVRGLDDEGVPAADAWATFERGELARLGWSELAASDARRASRPKPESASSERRPGSVTLIGADLEREDRIRCDLPAPLSEVLAHWVDAFPEHASGARPAVFRDGRRLGPADAVRAGDRLDLVTAIAGG